MISGFTSCKFGHIPRERNQAADKLSKDGVQLDEHTYVLHI